MTGRIHSKDIQKHILELIRAKDFNAPYGILSGDGLSKKGKKYLHVTFGRARTLDATVEIYNKDFVLIRTNRHGIIVFDKLDELYEFLNTL